MEEDPLNWMGLRGGGGRLFYDFYIQHVQVVEGVQIFPNISN